MLIETVKSLEGRSAQERKERIVAYLAELGVEFERQPYTAKNEGFTHSSTHTEEDIERIEVDGNLVGENIYVPSRKPLEIAIASHFDLVPGSPGANDNASAVAVTLELVTRFFYDPTKNIGVRSFFFDHEELGLVGAQQYLWQHTGSEILGCYNMELVGMGKHFALWNVEDGERSTLIDALHASASDAGRETYHFSRIITNSADHVRFREAGIEDAFTITTISDAELELYDEYLAAVKKYDSSWLPKRPKKLADMLQKSFLLKARKIQKQAPLFQHYHESTDTAEHLSEETLVMVADHVEEAIRRIDSKQLNS